MYCSIKSDKEKNMLLENIQLLLAAYVMSDKAIVRIMNLYVGEFAGKVAGTWMLYVCVSISLLLLFLRRDLKDLLKVTIIFVIIYFFQMLFHYDMRSIFEEYQFQIIVIGISGFIVGRSINKFKKYIKYYGSICFIIGIVLFMEPINREILQVGTQMLGYTMMPIIIGLLMRWNDDKKKRFHLILALILSVFTIIFTERGCGLSIIAVLFFLWKLNTEHIKKRYIKVGLVILPIAFILLLSWDMIYSLVNTSLNISSSSFLNKLMQNQLFNDNDRIKIINYCLMFLRQSPLTGLGVGVGKYLLLEINPYYPYPHNIIIELFIDFGIPFSVLLLYLYVKICRSGLKYAQDKSEKFVIIALLCEEWIKLMVSDSYVNNTFTIMVIIGFAMSMKNISIIKHKLK